MFYALTRYRSKVYHGYSLFIGRFTKIHLCYEFTKIFKYVRAIVYVRVLIYIPRVVESKYAHNTLKHLRGGLYRCNSFKRNYTGGP